MVAAGSVSFATIRVRDLLLITGVGVEVVVVVVTAEVLGLDVVVVVVVLVVVEDEVRVGCCVRSNSLLCLSFRFSASSKKC